MLASKAVWTLLDLNIIVFVFKNTFNAILLLLRVVIVLKDEVIDLSTLLVELVLAKK